MPGDPPALAPLSQRWTADRQAAVLSQQTHLLGHRTSSCTITAAFQARSNVVQGFRAQVITMQGVFQQERKNNLRHD